MKRESLKSAHARLLADLGVNCPSYITIKRMSARGDFKGMDLPQIETSLRSKYRQIDKRPAQTEIQNSPGNEEVLVALARISQRLEKIESGMQAPQGATQSQQLLQAAQQVSAVRNTLMAKYDAVCSQQAQTIETQRQLIKDLQSSSVLSMEIGRLRGQMQSVLDKLNL